MADAVVQLVMRARDEATAKIRAVSGELGGLSKATGKLAGAFGLGGLGVSAIVTAALATGGLAASYAAAVKEAQRIGSTMGQSREEFAVTSRNAAALTTEVNRLKRGWAEFNTELGKKALGPATAAVQLANSDWREWLVLITQGVHQYAYLHHLREQARIDADREAEGIERTRAALLAKAEAEKAAADARKKAVAELSQTMGIPLVGSAKDKTGADATSMLDILAQIDRAKKANDIMQRLFEGLGGEGKATNTSGDAQPRFGAPRFGMPTVDSPIAFDQAARSATIKEMLKNASKLSGEMAILITQFNIVARTAQTTSGAVLGAFQAWDFGSKGAADRIRENFRSALQAIADDVFRLGLGAVLGFAGTAIGGPVGGFIGKVGGDLIGGNSLAPARGAGGAVQITNIYSTAFSTKDAFDQLQSSGQLGQAQARQRILKRAGHN